MCPLPRVDSAVLQPILSASVTDQVGGRVQKATLTAAVAGRSPASSVTLLFFKSGTTPSQDELRAMATVKHAKLAHFFAFSALPDGRFCVVAEPAAHGSLRAFLIKLAHDGTPASLTQRLTMARQAGDGLNALHLHRLVHADVDVRHVFVYHFDSSFHNRTVVKLGSVGLARPSGSNVVRRHEGLQDPVSHKTLAPERLSLGHIGEAGDVWSFAVLLWELLGSCKQDLYPSVADDRNAMLAHLKAGERLPWPAECKEAGLLDKTLQSCWSLEPTARPELNEVLTNVSEARDAALQKMALEKRQQAWCDPRCSWKSKGIELSPKLDSELVYVQRDGFLQCDLLNNDRAKLADNFKNAVEQLVRSGGYGNEPFNVNFEELALCKNQELIEAFNASLKRMRRQRTNSPEFFNASWRCNLTQEQAKEKQDVYDNFQQYFVHAGKESGGVKVALMWHGVSCKEVADKILKTGLSSRAVASRGNNGDDSNVEHDGGGAATDDGFFGSGIYFTPEAEYAAFYAGGQKDLVPGKLYTLLLCAVAVANPYPLTWAVDYNEGSKMSNFDFRNLSGPPSSKGLKREYDAHLMRVASEENYHVPQKLTKADVHEMVVNQESHVLPFVKVVLKRT